MYTFNSYYLTYRAWQKKLHALVKTSEHKAEIYSCLWMLLHEADEEAFREKGEMFVAYWKDKEPKFVEYYKKEYSHRPGEM